MAERKSGEGTSAASAAPGQKEVIDVKGIPEPVVPIEMVNKRKENTEVAPEKSRKKIRTVALAKKRKEEIVMDIHVFSADEPGLCFLLAGSTLIEPETEKKIEDLEQEAKTVLLQEKKHSRL